MRLFHSQPQGGCFIVSRHGWDATRWPFRLSRRYGCRNSREPCSGEAGAFRFPIGERSYRASTAGGTMLLLNGSASKSDWWQSQQRRSP